MKNQAITTAEVHGGCFSQTITSTDTYMLSHADRNLINEVLSANQTNLSAYGVAIRRQLDRSIGVSMPTYPVQLHVLEAAWLRKEIACFECYSVDTVLRYLCQDTLPVLKQKLGQYSSADTVAYTAIKGRYRAANHRIASTWLDHGIFSKAFTSAVGATALACLAMWGIIEALHYFTITP